MSHPRFKGWLFEVVPLVELARNAPLATSVQRCYGNVMEKLRQLLSRWRARRAEVDAVAAAYGLQRWPGESNAQLLWRVAGCVRG